jgi:hypothetical protein
VEITATKTIAVDAPATGRAALQKSVNSFEVIMAVPFYKSDALIMRKPSFIKCSESVDSFPSYTSSIPRRKTI